MNVVNHIHVAVDDDVKNRGVSLKDAHGLTWEEFMVECFDAFEYVNGDGSE